MSTSVFRCWLRAYLKDTRNRALIGTLKGLMRAMKTRAFKVAFRVLTFPVLYPWVMYQIFAAMFGRKPKLLGMRDASVIAMWEQIEAARNAPVKIEASDTEAHRRLMQALTWGVAGFAMFSLIQIATAQPPTHVTMARWVAGGCFVLVVPWLATLGFKVSCSLDPKVAPLTVQQTINMHASMYAGILVFCIGFASLLWSYSPSISGLFILSCVVSLRRFLSFSKKLAVKPRPSGPSIIRLT